jgi:S-adenosylmethionine:tRNA ribosyltransferase-isomerase
VRRAASRPPEERGLSRDGVRLLVATPDGVIHARFADLPRFLAAGDLLVVNTSATVAAEVDGLRGDGRPVLVHFSSPLDEDTPWTATAAEGPSGDRTWLVELREDAAATGPVTDAAPGESVTLPAGGTLTLLRRYPGPTAARIWAATVEVGGPPGAFLALHGRPIRYSYVPDPWPLSAYQTVFARVPGSAEMPSAGRPFTAGLVTDLVSAGVVIAPITLHAGVASLEAHEPPLPERFSVPEPTAQLVNLARAEGRRVVAAGTTCTRALESATDPGGAVHGRRGWTSLVLGGSHPARTVSALITGWHDPEASHLALLEAVAGPKLVAAAYREAEKAGYLWHEFGDSCLLLPPLPGGPR